MGRAQVVTVGTTKARKPPVRDPGQWHERFFDAYRNSGIVRAAAQAAGVSRQAVYKAKLENPDFRAKWDDAREDAIEGLEAAARQRAMNHSDTLLIFLLKAARPTVYRDSIPVADSGSADIDKYLDHLEGSDKTVAKRRTG